MTTRVEAEKAAHVYRETQPAIDAFKDITVANAAAKKILIAYMVAKNLPRFRGIKLTTVKFEGLDLDKLRADLGAKVEKFKVERFRHHLEIIKQATASKL